MNSWAWNLITSHLNLEDSNVLRRLKSIIFSMILQEVNWIHIRTFRIDIHSERNTHTSFNLRIISEYDNVSLRPHRRKSVNKPNIFSLNENKLAIELKGECDSSNGTFFFHEVLPCLEYLLIVARCFCLLCDESQYSGTFGGELPVGSLAWCHVGIGQIINGVGDIGNLSSCGPRFGLHGL